MINLAPLAGFEAKCEFLKFKVSSGAYRRAETHFIEPEILKFRSRAFGF
nr:hypothetical protein [uncultured Campylobacter sp.]